MKVTEVYIVVDKSYYSCEYHKHMITSIMEVYLTEDAAKERVKQLGYGCEYIKRIVR